MKSLCRNEYFYTMTKLECMPKFLVIVEYNGKKSCNDRQTRLPERWPEDQSEKMGVEEVIKNPKIRFLKFWLKSVVCTHSC